MFAILRRSTFFRYITKAEDAAYRGEFAITDPPNSDVALLRQEMQTVTRDLITDGFPTVVTTPLASIEASFGRRCATIHAGVPLLRRVFTILVPTVIYAALAFFLPIEINNLGFVAAGAGTLIFTLLLASSLAFLFPPADTSLAIDHALARVLPALPALLAFYLTLVPGLEYLRSNRGYRTGAIIVQVLGLSVCRYWSLVQESYLRHTILRDAKLSLEQRRRLAAKILPLLHREKSFVDDADRRSANGTVTDHMTMAIAPLKSESGFFVYILVELTEVRVPTQRAPIWPKLFLVFLTAIIGVFNVIVYKSEELTVTDKIGWTIMATLTMLSFALLRTYSLNAATVQFMKLIVGTIINTVLVTIAVFATNGRVLQITWAFILVTGFNTLVLLGISHLISQWLSVVGMALTKLITGSDPNAEREANFALQVRKIEHFANGGTEEDEADHEEIPLQRQPIPDQTPATPDEARPEIVTAVEEAGEGELRQRKNHEGAQGVPSDLSRKDRNRSR